MENIITLNDKIVVASSLITAIATVIIAIYAICSHRLAQKIESQSKTYQNKFHELLLSITSATLVSGKTVGEPKLATQLFSEQKEKLRKELSNIKS